MSLAWVTISLKHKWPSSLPFSTHKIISDSLSDYASVIYIQVYSYAQTLIWLCFSVILGKFDVILHILNLHHLYTCSGLKLCWQNLSRELFSRYRPHLQSSIRLLNRTNVSHFKSFFFFFSQHSLGQDIPEGKKDERRDLDTKISLWHPSHSHSQPWFFIYKYTRYKYYQAQGSAE